LIVLDTHVFIWYILDSPQLPAQMRDELSANPESVWLPSICFWEIHMLAEKGRLSFGKGSPERLLEKYFELSGFKEAPLTKEIAFLSRNLTFHHEDPADRFIAATAKSLNASLATSDRNLRILDWIKIAY
jgi:PIN domain nuclease of toxin-antitoxin system